MRFIVKITAIAVFVFLAFMGYMIITDKPYKENKFYLSDRYDRIYSDNTDKPFKTQNVKQIIYDSGLVKKQIEEILFHELQKSKRINFQYRGSVEFVYIYAYDSDESYKKGLEYWNSMLSYQDPGPYKITHDNPTASIN